MRQTIKYLVDISVDACKELAHLVRRVLPGGRQSALVHVYILWEEAIAVTGLL